MDKGMSESSAKIAAICFIILAILVMGIFITDVLGIADTIKIIRH